MDKKLRIVLESLVTGDVYEMVYLPREMHNEGLMLIEAYNWSRKRLFWMRLVTITFVA